MAREREEIRLEELRAAWRGLTPPPPPDAVEECDVETRTVVDWMRCAFEGLEVPPVLQEEGASSPRSFALPLAAAASVLLAVGLWLATHVGSTSELPAAGGLVAELPETGSSDAAPSEEPVVAALGPDRIEMRSGPVRLVLLQPTGGR